MNHLNFNSHEWIPRIHSYSFLMQKERSSNHLQHRLSGDHYMNSFGMTDDLDLSCHLSGSKPQNQRQKSDYQSRRLTNSVAHGR